MSNYVSAMWPGSLPEESLSASGRSSRLSATGSRSPRSSRSRSSVSSRWSSGSRSRPRRGSRSRSRSRSRRRHQRKYRRYSRSYSRSRSRSRSRRRRHRERHYVSSRRYYRSPSPSPDRSRSRSRSRGRSYYRRAYAVMRGRRYYGFGRSVYPEERRSWRARSRTRSRSPTPFRLSEKDRMELLEIAKANAAKALGTTNFELPPSLRVVPGLKETNHETAIPNKGAKFELSEKLTEDGTANASEKSSQQKSSSFNNFVAKPMLQKSAKATAEETSSGSPKTQKKSPYELWKPV